MEIERVIHAIKWALSDLKEHENDYNYWNSLAYDPATDKFILGQKESCDPKYYVKVRALVYDESIEMNRLPKNKKEITELAEQALLKINERIK